MSFASKLLWPDGLRLQAQHLQQLDRYHEARLHHRVNAMNPHAWGVRTARWNLDVLARGTLQAEELLLVLRDGEIVQAPWSDPLPLPIDLSALPLDQQSFTIYAALPVMQAHGGNVAATGSPSRNERYVQREQVTLDLFTEALDCGVTYLAKRLSLLSHLEPRSAFETVAVAKVRRKADNTFELDSTFIPPAMSVDGAPGLQELMRSLIGKMTAKAEALAHLQRESRRNVGEVQVGDVSSFWMLSTIMSALGPLSHCANASYTQPVHLFDRLLALAGGLMALSRTFSLAELPRYEHESPTEGFQSLVNIIRELLDTVISSKYVPLPMSRKHDDSPYHTAELPGALIEAKARLYLAVNADMPAVSLVAEIPRQLKIGAPTDVELLVRSALPGVLLVHLPQVPFEVPVRPNTYYFAIENRGDGYDAMMKAQALAVYAPTAVKGLRMELFALMG